MKGLNSCCHAVSVGALAAVLAACGGNQSAAPQLPPTPVHIGSASVEHSAHRVSPDGIVYTPVNVKIKRSKYNLDLNNDKMADFVIWEHNWRSSCKGRPFYQSQLGLDTQGSNGVEGSYYSAARLAKGSPIGPSQSFATGILQMEYGWYGWMGNFGGCSFVHIYRGNWPPENGGYLGLALVISGQTHYGWAAITVSSPKAGWLAATLTGYAYQTKAGKTIMAGQM